MKYTDFMREIEKDQEYQEAREALKPYFGLWDAVLRERIRRGWSQAELAERAGTRQANISRIEAGLGEWRPAVPARCGGSTGQARRNRMSSCSISI